MRTIQQPHVHCNYQTPLDGSCKYVSDLAATNSSFIPSHNLGLVLLEVYTYTLFFIHPRISP